MWNAGFRLVLILAAGIDIACSQSQVAPPAPRNVGLVGFDPEDGQTAVTKAPAVIVTKDPSYSEIGYRDLIAQIGLRTWPALAPVAMSVRYVPRHAQTTASRNEIVPDRPLAEGWYTVRVGPLPQGYEWPPQGRRIALADGSMGSRFRIGSAPHLHRLRRCNPSGKTPTVSLEFSEALATKGKLADIVKVVTDTKVVCSSLDGSGGLFSMLTYACAGLAKAAAIDITIEAGLESKDGRPLAPPAKPLNVAGVEFAQWASDCSVYYPPFEATP